MAANPLGNFDLKKINIFANPLKMFFPKKMVGVDIGTASIKLVELSRWGQGKTLENYGEIKSVSVAEDAFRSVDRGSYLLSNYSVARAIRAILDEARIHTKEAVFAVPDFQCFSTSFELPPMSAKELKDAVYYTAPQYIPLPISETTLDWRLIKGEPDRKTPLKVFLVAIPNQVVQDYQNIAQLAGLQLYAVESEVMALTRAVVREKEQCVCLIDIGMQSTTISMAYHQTVKKSYSFDFTASQLGHAVASVLNLSESEGDSVKNQEGLVSRRQEVREALYLLIDPLLIETKKILADFVAEEGKGVDAIYLLGGTAALPGLKEYFQETLQKPVQLPNCFSDVLYPPILGPTLQKIANSFSVATGSALAGLSDL